MRKKYWWCTWSTPCFTTPLRCVEACPSVSDAVKNMLLLELNKEMEQKQAQALNQVVFKRPRTLQTLHCDLELCNDGCLVSSVFLATVEGGGEGVKGRQVTRCTWRTSVAAASNKIQMLAT